MVFADLGMSLDGFVAGANAGPDNPLGAVVNGSTGGSTGWRPGESGWIGPVARRATRTPRSSKRKFGRSGA